MTQKMTGIILAGGKSQRFGLNKALLKIGGKTVMEIMADRLKPIVADILISANSPEEYAFLKLPIVQDIYPNCGPLAGLHAALSRSTTDRNLVASCDMPLMSTEMIAYLAAYETGKKIVVMRVAGHMQFFPGIYRKSVLPVLEEILAGSTATVSTRRERSFYALIEKTKAEIIDPSVLNFYREELFFNMNTREDYDKIMQHLASTS